jgi:capsular exopolysaccharide synthesis family protein
MSHYGPGLQTIEGRAIEAGPGVSPNPGIARFESDRPKLSKDPERGGLFEVWRILRADFKTVLLAMGIGLAVAAALALIKKPMYTAKTELVIESPNRDFLGAQAISPVSEDPAEVSGLTDVETQLQIMQSDQMIDRVTAKLAAEGKLQPLESEASRPSLIGRLFRRPAPTPSEQTYKIHKLILRHLVVRQVGPTRAVDISYSSPDPGFAADLCNTFASEYIAYNTEARWTLSERTGEGLSRRLDAVRARLNDAQKNLQDYAERSGLLFGPPVPGTSEQTDVSENRLTDLQQEMLHAESDRMAAESRLKTAKTANSNSITEILNDDTLRDLRAKINDLQREKADLLTIYTPDYEKVVRAQAQLTSLQAAFAKHLSDIQARIMNDYNSALRRENLLKAAYDQQVGVVTNKNSKEIQYRIYKQQADSDQKLYDSMLEQVNRASIASAAGTSNIQVFSDARPPLRPDSSGLVVYSAGGVLFGLLAGSMLVFTRTASNRTFHSPGQSLSQVHLREIGIIPRYAVESKKTAARLLVTPDSRDLTKPDERSFAASQANRVELACFWEKSGALAESYRMLLASIMLADGAGKRPQTLVITSANPREGKTTTLCNLAIAMAETRKRVLVIDGDLRRPRLHDVFGLSNERGLRNVLMNSSEERPFEEFVQQTFIRGIDVLPSGTAHGDSEASLFYASHLANLIEAMRKSYDLILIDTPPCLHLADARVIGRASDAVILVTRTGHTTWSEGRTVAQHFSEDGTRIMGTVLNDLKQSLSAYSYLSEYSQRVTA